MRRKKWKPVGARSIRFALLHPDGGFKPTLSCGRLLLKSIQRRLVSRMGMRGLRWFADTSKMKQAVIRRVMKHRPMGDIRRILVKSKRLGRGDRAKVIIRVIR